MSKINALHQVPYFSHLTNEELWWLFQQGNEVRLNSDSLLFAEGSLADNFYVLIEGKLQVMQEIGDEEVSLISYEPGSSFGEVSILLKSPYTSSVRALGECHLFRLGKDAFYQMLATCPSVKYAILLTMEQRMQMAQGVPQQHEKLIGLGTIAAGLAHELNNPASAGQRAAGQLRETFHVLRSLVQKLNQQLSPAQQAFFAQLERNAIERTATSPSVEPLVQSDQEYEVKIWLEAHGIADGWKLAPTLVGTGLDTEWLDTIKEHIAADSLVDVLTCLEATLAMIGLLDEVGQSTDRISKLVKVVKEYSYMDQAPLQEVDVHDGIESTLILLGHKLKGGVVVTREYDRRLPRICVHGSDLNQVWTNLIDNAIDATSEGGQIWVRTSEEEDHVLVEIADNGYGIPPDIQSRIFEPFFTTKGVGEGTGLGLSLSYRVVVRMHHGSISVFSKPGNTRFQVRLPIEPL